MIWFQSGISSTQKQGVIMKFRLILSATVLVFSAFSVGSVFAQANMDHGKMGMAAMPSMTDGEVRKIDKEAGKITIKHAEIKHMEMPGMTMVFLVREKALLDKVEVGQKIQFIVVQENGKMIVSDIKSEK